MHTHTVQSTSASEMLSVGGSSQLQVSSYFWGHYPSAKIQSLRVPQMRGSQAQATFSPPRSFGEFYSRFPRHVHDFVRRHMISRPREEQQDRESELLYFLMSLPETSKFRRVGTNGYETGCLDRIMTFDPARYGGASPGQFLSYINRILLNRFISLERKYKSDPICRSDTLYLGDSQDEYSGGSNFNISIDLASVETNVHTLGQNGQAWSHLVVQRFVTFVKRYNPELLPVLSSLSICRKLCEVQAESGLNGKALCRARSRLRMLYRCFQSGSHPAKQRRLYRDRVARQVRGRGETTPSRIRINPAHA